MTQTQKREAPIYPAKEAVQKCSEWLLFCLGIGWEKSQLDALEKIWWKHYDLKGNLIK